MSYKLEFLPSARKEWDKLGVTLREQFKKKLGERLAHPRVPADALHGWRRSVFGEKGFALKDGSLSRRIQRGRGGVG